jgi:hypothetical protein
LAELAWGLHKPNTALSWTLTSLTPWRAALILVWMWKT